VADLAYLALTVLGFAVLVALVAVVDRR